MDFFKNQRVLKFFNFSGWLFLNSQCFLQYALNFFKYYATHTNSGTWYSQMHAQFESN